MKVIIGEYPPNIKKIEAVLGKDPIESGVVYTYGSTIYNPHGGYIPDDLMVHEETHMKQHGDDPAAWWDKYLVDPEFRLHEELEAYRNQYKQFRSHSKNRDRQKSFLFAYKIATDLSGPIYGNIISRQDALNMIKSGI
mgnify:CR=1 FL=1